MSYILQAQQEALAEATTLLQMPPVLPPRDNDYTEVLSEDPDITGFDAAKLVFTDITYGLTDLVMILYIGEEYYCVLVYNHPMRLYYFPH